jgi:hypothetical protein
MAAGCAPPIGQRVESRRTPSTAVFGEGAPQGAHRRHEPDPLVAGAGLNLVWNGNLPVRVGER